MKINICDITKRNKHSIVVPDDIEIHTLKCVIRELMDYDVDNMHLMVDRQFLTDENKGAINFTKNRHNMYKTLFIAPISSVINDFFINQPTKIAINIPPNGSNT